MSYYEAICKRLRETGSATIVGNQVHFSNGDKWTLPPEECSDDPKYREAARARWEKDGDLEIDDDSVVSVSDDGGAYVAAWVWVSDKESGVKREGAKDDDEE